MDLSLINDWIFLGGLENNFSIPQYEIERWKEHKRFAINRRTLTKASSDSGVNATLCIPLRQRKTIIWINLRQKKRQKREWEKREGAAGHLKYRVSLLEASIDEPSVDASTVIVTGAMQKSSWLHASVYNLHTYLDTRCLYTVRGLPSLSVSTFVSIANPYTGS
ncbi:hypothetical protein WN51_00437 [Melipona quadrifasciata]|uniref:Uncharacterized protein n=1 Tax=Melipona quadrifasciata TaxID=166423 RepID=A0A0N0BG96_9HYME|nr:hypothetical protein WN51_00437 [Melipona quadrifasciata]